MKRNPQFSFPNLALDLTTARRDNPDQWLEALGRIVSPDIRAWFVCQHHASKAYWFNLNGKWVRR